MAASRQSAPGSRHNRAPLRLGASRRGITPNISHVRFMIARACAVLAALFALAIAMERAQAGGDATTSGLPVPRFVSLKTDRVNVRGGPDKDHDVTFIYTRVGWPVEITAEFENWRRIRDSDGSEGWVYHSLLSGKRTAVVQLKSKTDLGQLARQARRAEPGDCASCSPACSDRSSIAPAPGAALPVMVLTAGSSKTGCGASIPTRRSSKPHLRRMDVCYFCASNSAIRPLRISVGGGGHPRMCRSTGTTAETPPATA